MASIGDLVDYNWKEIDYHKDAVLIRKYVVNYLKSKKIGNSEKFATGLYTESLGSAVYRDQIQDKDPKNSNLGAYFYATFKKTKASKSSDAFLKSTANQMAYNFYAAHVNFILFDPRDVQFPLFATMLAKSAHAAGVAYLKYDKPKYADIADAAGGAIGDVLLQRLGEPYRAAQITDPAQWATRAKQRAQTEKTFEIQIEAQLIAMEADLLNAKTLKTVAQNALSNAEMQAYLDKKGHALSLNEKDLTADLGDLGKLGDQLQKLRNSTKVQKAVMIAGGGLLLTGIVFAVVRR